VKKMLARAQKNLLRGRFQRTLSDRKSVV